jgi:uncharacterized membrane protein
MSAKSYVNLEKNIKKAIKKRSEILDLIRACAIISMICYHAVWDIVNIFNTHIQWYNGTIRYIWQQSICWLFIFLSGFCLPLGRNPLMRGIKVFIAGALVSIITVMFIPDDKIIFGILTLIGSCMILVAVFDKLLRKIPPKIGFIVCCILFFLTRNINRGFLGFENFNLIKLPSSLYNGYLATYIGFTDSNFFSTDYFSLFPWIFLFTAGYFFKHMLKKKKIFAKLKIPRSVSFIGKNSLPIYMVHQPVIYFLLKLLFLFKGIIN